MLTPPRRVHIAIFSFAVRTFLSVYLRILPRQKTRSRHITGKCVIANSIGLYH